MADGPASIPPLLPDPVPYEVTDVTDGDTLRLEQNGEVVKARFLFINAPECGKGGRSSEKRCQRGEEGGGEARETLKNLLDGFGNRVYLKTFGEDAHGRTLAMVFGKEADGGYHDVSLAMVRRGCAHVFMIEQDKLGLLPPYAQAEKLARQEGLGIWKNHVRFRGPLHITSFHPTRHRLEDNPEKKDNPRAEYMRIANISGAAVELGGLILVNDDRQAVLPPFSLLPGYAVQVFTHYGTTAELPAPPVINLGSDGPLWDKSYPIVLKRPTGEVIDAVATNKEAKSDLPNGF